MARQVQQFALTRSPSPAMGDCELTHLERAPIDMALLCVQHARYATLLRELGRRVIELPALPDMPDAVFVEDGAVVLDELALITRPGAASRRGETESLAQALAPHRELARIEAPGTLDGGDVLVCGKVVFVGQSTRSNAAGLQQLEQHVRVHGYEVHAVSVRECLHLKSAACALGGDSVLLQADWVDSTSFKGASLEGCEIVTTAAGEVGAANVVCLGRDLIYPRGFPRTRDKLVALGFDVHELDYSELAKAEGGVTCCSLLFSA